jgi:hypothetical protein
MLRCFALAALAAFSAIVLFAADPGGDWKGSFDFNGTAVPLTFHLKTADNALTGSVEGLPTTPVQIKDGKIDGDNVTFAANTDYQGSDVHLIYKAKIDGDEMKVTMGTDDGSFSVDFVLKRVTN